MNLIREATTTQQWFYVKTNENPADLVSRGTKAKSFRQDPKWLNGPQFLLKDQNKWPKASKFQSELHPNDPEVKPKIIMVNSLVMEEKLHPLNKLIDYYSSWDGLKRAVAWLLKLKETLIQMKEKRNELQSTFRKSEKDQTNAKAQMVQQMKQYKEKLQKVLTLKDLQVAENELISHTQRQWFDKELQILQRHQQVKRNSSLYKLDPILQEGILKVGGRLNKGVMPEYTKHPAILSKHSRVASLILQDIHERIGHCGRNYVLSKLRQKNI